MSRKEKIILAELDVCEIAAIWDELHQIETEIQAVERTRGSKRLSRYWNKDHHD
jgi:hypothetical protein